MASGSAGTDVQNQLDALFRFGVVGDLSDAQLVQRFLTARSGAGGREGDRDDQTAFAALVDRHGPMVFSVCRDVLRNADDAQDAFQATFLVLARRAGSVRKADSVASWLHGVALRVALRARTVAARRRACERRSAAEKAAARRDGQGGWPDQWPELHEEIARLPGRYREPVVLYYLEGLSTEEAAARLGCPHGTILSRLSRARDRLRARLERRGFAPAMVLTAGLSPRPAGALPARLVETTVRAALEFVRGQAGEAASAAASTAATEAASTLAKGVLSTMTLSKLKLLGALTIIGGFAWGGLHAVGQLAVGGGQPKPGGAAQADGNRRSGLPSDRSVESIENELDNAARHISEMQKSITSLREELAARRGRQEPSVAARTAIRLADALKADPVRAVKRLANALIQHAPRFDGFSPHATQIYLMDVASGDLTLIVAEPAREFPLCGMPTWSQDGGRILFEAAREDSWPRTLSRLFAVEEREGRPVFTDLGLGNSPTLSPDGKWIAFSLHPSAELGADTGVWLMRSDGSERRRVGEFGAPYWSLNGKEFLINSYSLPTESTVLNLETKEASVIHVAEHQIFSWPSWVGPGTMVAVLSPKEKYEGDTIAVIDVRNPAEAKIIEVLWKRSGDFDVIPRWPVYRPETGQCFFTGEVPNKRGLYTVRRGDPRGARSTGWCVENLPNTYLASPCFSPDGRYLLFHAYGPVVKEIAVLDR